MILKSISTTKTPRHEGKIKEAVPLYIAIKEEAAGRVESSSRFDG
jgi:hypothetical protein